MLPTIVHVLLALAIGCLSFINAHPSYGHGHGHGHGHGYALQQQQQQNVTQPQQSIYTNINQQRNVSIFSQLINVTGLMTILNATQGITVMVPTNAAFEQLSQQVLDVLQQGPALPLTRAILEVITQSDIIHRKYKISIVMLDHYSLCMKVPHY